MLEIGCFLVDRGSFQLIIPSDNTESTHTYCVLDRAGKFIIDDEEIQVEPGDTIIILPNKVFSYEGEMIMTLGMTPNFKEDNEHIVRQVVSYEQKNTSKK